MNRRITAAAIVAALLLAGCSSNDEPPSPTSAPSVSTVAAASLPAGIRSEAAGSGKLEQMVVHTDANFIHIQAKGPTPTTGTVLYTVLAGPYRLGLKSVDGAVTISVIDSDSGEQKTFDTSYTYLDGTVSFQFPRADLAKFTGSLVWAGILSIDGKDVDSTGSIATK